MIVEIMNKGLFVLMMIVLTVQYAAAQLNGTYSDTKSKKSKTELTLTKDNQFVYTTYTRGHLNFDYYEKGDYQNNQDTLILIVKEYGVDEDSLETQINYLERKVLIRKNKAFIIDEKGKVIDSLTKRNIN